MNKLYMESVIKNAKAELDYEGSLMIFYAEGLLEVVDFLMKERETSTEDNSLEGLKPQDMECFKEVAKVIGEEEAKVQLQKVIDSFDEKEQYGYYDFKSGILINSFDWENTPQRYTFWDDIYNGVKP